MSEIQQYPTGIEYRTPRPRGTAAGAVLGSIFGLLLTQSPGGTAAGGVIGGILANQPIPLPQALRQKFAEKGLEIIHFYRLGRFGAKVLFRYQNAYWTLESHAPQNPPMTTEQIEDWLHGDLDLKAVNFLAQNNLRLHP